jgi:hypothetical protein
MNRLIYAFVAAAAAGGVAAAPAIAGLSHNPSFSHQLPVRVPSGAQTVNVDNSKTLTVKPTPSPAATHSHGREVEPGDDRGQNVRDNDVNDNDINDINDINDDNGRHGAALEPGDDNGRDALTVAPSSAPAIRQGEPEPGDDRGGARAQSVTASVAPQPTEAGDDGGHGGSSSGRGGGHGDH